jgi:hypothetical protein
MKALSSLFLTLTLTFAVYSHAQVNDQSIQKEVLNKAIVDSSFIFGRWTENGDTEIHLKYLGQVRTRNGQTFKILNSISYWGLSHRATSRILVFNGTNQYLGNYYVAMTTDLPTRMKNGKLIFRNIDNDCDKDVTTLIDLKNGLPKRFFRNCRGKYGDIYSFENE